MYEADRTHVVLVVAREDVLSNLRDAFCDTNFALLHAHTIQEGIALLERLKSQIDIAIVQLELQELSGWDMISQLTGHPQRPVQIIATISTFSLPLVQKAKELGIDDVVRTETQPEAWRRAVRATLMRTTMKQATL